MSARLPKRARFANERPVRWNVVRTTWNGWHDSFELTWTDKVIRRNLSLDAATTLIRRLNKPNSQAVSFSGTAMSDPNWTLIA